MKLFICAVLITIALSFLTSAQTQNTSKTEPDLCVEFENGGTIDLSDEDLIREIVFRKILELRRSNSDKTSKEYYLSIYGGKDPSKNLLKKFADYQVTIKKVSELFISVDDSDPFRQPCKRTRRAIFSFKVGLEK